VYRFSWELPENIENVDIRHFKFELDNESSITLANTSTEIILPLSYGEHNVSILVVDRCNKDSEAITLQLDVMKSECIANVKLECHSCVSWENQYTCDEYHHGNAS
jgi:hypothetical protein